MKKYCQYIDTDNYLCRYYDINTREIIVEIQTDMSILWKGEI